MEKAVDARAVQRLGEPTPTSVLGIDETRFSRPRWVRNTQTGKWRLTDPWQTVFVDLHGDQGLLGRSPGAPAPPWWPGETRGQAWRAVVEVVAIDRSPTTLHTACRRALAHRAGE
jgi:hypothetical protein